jgi:hypothetical protein
MKLLIIIENEAVGAQTERQEADNIYAAGMFVWIRSIHDESPENAF